MKIEYMEDLLAIRTFGNFTLAAENRFITQPALSRHIRELENELGVLLLIRNTHTVSFTEDGLRACAAFQKIVNRYQALQSEYAAAKNGMRGCLRLGMLYYTIKQDFGTVLPRFQEMYPNVKIKSFSCQPQDVFSKLTNDSIDIGCLSHTAYPNGESLRFQDIYKTPAFAIMNKSHPLSQKDGITLDDLRKETIIMFREDVYSNCAINEAFRRCGFIPFRICETENTDTVPFTILKNNAVHINGKGIKFTGYDEQLCIKEILSTDLYFIKAFAYKADNPNPLIPLFLNCAKTI